MESSLDKQSWTCKEEHEAFQCTITALQGLRDDLQVRCSATMSLKEVIVCENISPEEEIWELGKYTNALMIKKNICEKTSSCL